MAMYKQVLRMVLVLLSCWTGARAGNDPEFSTAGFYALAGTGRSVYSMDVAWRFYKGNAADASAVNFNDRDWAVVSLPHGLEYLPTEASGGINYQGPAWYRKHFVPDPALKGKKLFLHFEAIMGKSKVWVNGKLLATHFGGYLPVIADVTDAVEWGKDNVIVVWTDNSDDPSYPPGKPQNLLDFTYAGGIYRDCWLVAHGQVHITDPNYEQVTAGGGVFVAYDRVSEKQAYVLLKVHVRNETTRGFQGSVTYQLWQKDGKLVREYHQDLRVNAGSAQSLDGKLSVPSPKLWSPDSPYLYNLHVLIKDRQGKVVDGYRKRIGIRSLEFKGKDGFWLNGKPYGKPLIGANRHQDFAVVGNALANSTHWRDAKKLRDIGLKVIRNAHYPQDPAFMDACDELGLFVIVNTPGWQFWNEDPVFGERVYNDIRQMIRRDRDHPSVWLWEPILNETHYPDDFARNAFDLVKEEYPYPSCYAGCDNEAKGKAYFPVLFSHPTDQMDPSKTYFTREWSDNVDDWNAQNSPSRVNRAWGEGPQLIQAQHHANPPYDYTCYETLCSTSPQHVGGCVWHAFDHQRGYHPDPFYGGLMDVFRQPKYTYYMFMAQRDPIPSGLIADTGPMVFIANEMTPFSSPDVTVYSNCDEVRLTVFKGGKPYSYKKEQRTKGMPSPIITFKDAYHYMDIKAMAKDQKQADVYLLAEGLMDGKVVATHKVAPAWRPAKLMLWLDDEQVPLHANGSDFVTVVAAVTDENGTIKRLNNQLVKFEVSGDGRILGGADVLANPRPLTWGTAPVLVQAGTHPGTIRIHASVLFAGSQTPLSASLEIKSHQAAVPLVYDQQELDVLAAQGNLQKEQGTGPGRNQELEQSQRAVNDAKLKEIERQQAEFGEKHENK